MWFNQCFVVILVVLTFNTIERGSAEDPPRKCFKCNSNQDSSCIQSPSPTSECESRGGFCYIHVSDEGVVRRGCVDQSDDKVPSPNYCDDKRDICTVCSDREKCNDKKFEVERCYKTNYDFKNPIEPSDSISQQCPMQPLGCFHMERDKRVEKGCLSSLNKQKQQEYKQSKDCELCPTQNCNYKVVRNIECYQCNNTDVNCAEPTELEDLVNYTNTSSGCLIGIDNNGYTHRIGNSNSDADKFPKGFEACYNSTCNNFIYPKDRVKCIQCQGQADCNLGSVESRRKLTPKVCQIYSPKENCFTYLANDGKIHRGCLSDKTQIRKTCEQNDERCTKCDESGCNNEPRSAGNSHFRIQNQYFIQFILISSGVKLLLSF